MLGERKDIQTVIKPAAAIPRLFFGELDWTGITPDKLAG